MNNINMNKLLALFTVFATFLGTSYGKTIYVNANFPTAGNGTSWDSPYTNLQDAVTASVAGDLVLVTNGVYSPIDTGNKAITIQSVNGYADTIIDGGGMARCASLGTGVKLVGFMVRNGYVSGDGGGVALGSLYDSVVSNNLATTHGGGIYGASVVSNCVVAGNIVTGTANWDGGGGTHNCTTVMDSLISGNIATNGLYTKGGGSHGGTLYRCRVENNLGIQGGGVANSHVYDSVICGNESFVNGSSGGGYWAVNTTYSVSNCVISSNSALGAGGGIRGGTLRNCVVSNNVATVTDSGGVRDAMVYDSLIVNNSATRNGGGSYGGTLTGCTISGNTAAQYGGGSYGGTLTGCTISGNTAAQYGGGSYGGTLTGCTISGNTAAQYGGGSYGGTLTGCTISGNTANARGGGTCYSVVYNSAIYANTATVAWGALARGRYYNCTIYGNTAPDYAVGFANGHASEPSIYNCVIYGNVNTGANTRHLQIPASGVFAFSSIDGANRFSTTLTPAQFVQSIYGDPLFTNPLLNDFSLRPESPCINKGANQHVTTATDLAGRPRIKDWRVDMGAYENQSQRFAVTPNPLYPMGRMQLCRLPAGYRECDYLESSGTQYIDTGFLFNRSTDDFVIDFSCNLPSYANQNIFGSYVASTNCVGLFARSTGFWAVRWDATRQTPAALSTSRTVVRSNRVAGNACVNGVSCTSVTTVSPASTTGVVLFGLREPNNLVTKNPAPMVLYGFEIYRDGEDAMKLVPCLSPSNVPGMYDLVGATFYDNDGTGNFTYELK